MATQGSAVISEATASAISLPVAVESAESGPPAAAEKRTVSRRLIQLDFVRGLAILAVMAFHYLGENGAPGAPHWLTFLCDTGWVGVDLFFVLSGFLVGGLLFSEYQKTGDVRFKRFLIRRAFKIWPSYYLYILFQVIVHKHPLSSFLVQNVTNLQNYLGTSLKHTWSLAVEEHFYLLLAALFGMLKAGWISRSSFARLSLLLCSETLLLRCALVLTGHREGIAGFTHTRIDSMFFGVVLAYLAFFNEGLFTRILNSKAALIATAFSAAVFILAVPKNSPWMLSVGFTMIYLGAASLLLLLYRNFQKASPYLPYKAVAWIGLYSYSIYLWHLAVREPIRNLVSRFNAFNNFWWLAPLGEFCTAIALGFCAARMVEWPVLRLRERFMPFSADHAVHQ